jgi:hypothetical protein
VNGSATKPNLTSIIQSGVAQNVTCRDGNCTIPEGEMHVHVQGCVDDVVSTMR